MTAEATGAREALIEKTCGSCQHLDTQWLHPRAVCGVKLPPWAEARIGARGVDRMVSLDQACSLHVPKEGTPPSASPEECDCGHLRECHSPLAESVGRRSCSLCPCMAYGVGRPSQHSASPEAGQSPSRAAQDTADGRVWRLFVRGDGSVYGFPVGLGPGSFEALDSLVPVVPRSELARVQREREEALNEMMHWNGESVRLENENTTLRAQLAAAKNRVDVAYQQRDAALDRARVAEQRIETGIPFFIEEHGHGYMGEPTPNDIVRYGVITRGRFVADTEDKA